MKKKIEFLKKLFKNQDLFEQALTHRSWINENSGKRQSNERLEFLGDAILEYVVSEELYRKLPEKEEGFLTALRAKIVNTQNLAKLANELGINGMLYMSKGEEQGGGQENISLLANTVEAVIGAIFIDRGLDEAGKFIKKYLLADLKQKLAEPLKDAKSRLQELIQAEGKLTPEYRVVKESGPDHNKIFEIEVEINGEPTAKGTGKNKNQAEQDAALKALVKLGHEG